MRSILAALFIVLAIVIAGGMDHRRELAESQAFASEPSQAFDFVGEDVRAHVTPELTYAVCGAYAKLRIYEDYTYDCLPA